MRESMEKTARKGLMMQVRRFLIIMSLIMLSRLILLLSRSCF